MRKFCFLVAAAAAAITPAIANAQEAEHFYMREILIPLKRHASTNPSPQPEPEPVASWKTGLFSIPRTASSCSNGLTVNRSVTCSLPNGTVVDDGQCTAAKPAEEQRFSCSAKMIAPADWTSRGSYPSQRNSSTVINLTGPMSETIEVAKQQAQAWCDTKVGTTANCIMTSFDYRSSDQAGIYRVFIGAGTGGSSTSPTIPSGYTRSHVLLEKRYSTKYVIGASASEFSNCAGSSYFLCE